MTSPEPLLEARGAGRRFGACVALAPVDLEVVPGELLALAGANGAGKSTLLALLAGALEPTEGRVERRARTGWMPQRPSHYGRLSARENLELFARLERAPAAPVTELLERLELPDEARPSATLSLGNRQRLNLALALLGEPEVLLLDEPSASLDPRGRARLWELAAALRAAGGAVVFATQNLDEVEERADRAAVLVDGVLAFVGDPAQAARVVA